ncbi:HD domain-containing protein [Actinomadura citrea]|uniref:Putative hydrolase (HD superfamily) n=1 Tax=Actinomadura citrea TaxID=46158 RepID=A0A7Y9GBQ5_9ACTN|nr:HD domain-containing protein [Actinomadura citrea]NYE12185.1 putative hydrolase (HD superfamily) [Actinomadura citrea]
MKKHTAAWARDLARKHLETPLPRRWAHTQGVARQARTLSPILGNQADLLEAAAWLHDIGYAPDLMDTGFHPVDGARYLRDFHHAEDHLCRLVAHHSCAIIEARERGLSDVLVGEFGAHAPIFADALIYCDMTTSPDGMAVTVERRLSEILERYGRGHLVTKAITNASPHLLRATQKVGGDLLLAKRAKMATTGHSTYL